MPDVVDEPDEDAPPREAVSPEEATTSASLEFNIEFNDRTGTDAGFGNNPYFEKGVLTFGEGKVSFREHHPEGNPFPPGMYFPDPQWEEGAKRLLSGHDRTAFILPRAATYKTDERVPVWRDGDRVYSTVVAEKTGFELYDPYQGIKSLSTIKAEGKGSLRVISLQAIRDYLSSCGLTQEQLEELERPCATCGQEIRRCNRCEECLNCRGGVGNEEDGYCMKCKRLKGS